MNSLAQHLRTCDRWWQQLRHHRASQLFHRSARLVRRQLRARPSVSIVTGTFALDASSILAPVLERHRHAWRAKLQRLAEAHKRNELCYLGVARPISEPIDWRCESGPPASHLWRFHLHYQDDLLAGLNDSGIDAEVCPQAWGWILDWIFHNEPSDPRCADDAWHPFCISRRIINWILLWVATSRRQEGALPLTGDDKNRVLTSLATQAQFLNDHLEWDLRGNHLLVNLQALAVASAFFTGPLGDRLGESVGRYLPAQLEEQILPGGEHFERSPMYHLQMLEAMLDLRDALATRNPQLAERCRETAVAMARCATGIMHPDGTPPLLSDSALDESPDLSSLAVGAFGKEYSGSDAIPLGGIRCGDYWTFRDNGNYLLFDAGPVGPDELPAHAHCDLLSFESSFAGRRLFVDSGVHDYDDGDMRAYCRSTAAHNTLQIDDVEQCDVWSRFRMGARGRPSGIECGREGEFEWARSTHNSYRRIGVPEVGRWICCRAGGPWLAADWARGTGTRRITLRWHLHPDWSLRLLTPKSVLMTGHGQQLVLSLWGNGRLEEQTGWYCPGFGTRHAAPVIAWIEPASLPRLIAWSVEPGDSPGPLNVQHDESLSTAVLNWQSSSGGAEHSFPIL